MAIDINADEGGWIWAAGDTLGEAAFYETGKDYDFHSALGAAREAARRVCLEVGAEVPDHWAAAR